MTTLFALLVFGLPEVKFPDNFLGTWRGKLLIKTPGKDSSQDVAFSLKIGKTDKDGEFTYVISYEGQAARDYKLVRHESEKDHWLIDEGGGIVLDAYWCSDRLTTPFTVGKNTIVTTLRREGRNLVWETMTLSLNPIVDGKVVGHRLTNTQNAVLGPVDRAK